MHNSFQSLDVGHGSAGREELLNRSPCPYRLVSRDVHKLNVTRVNRSFFQFGTWYHSLLEYSWWKLVILLVAVFIVINAFFGVLYFSDVDGINGISKAEGSFRAYYICFCFSVQTLTTIGYGSISPATVYIHTIAVLEGFLSFVASALLTGIVFAKMSRPTRLSRQILFSSVAVVNRVTSNFFVDPSTLIGGNYVQPRYSTISIRVANARRSQLCNTQVRLLLLRKECDGIPTFTADRRPRATNSIHELDFEIYNQLGRNRGISFSVPYLALPFTINHTINEDSPLFKIPQHEWNKLDNHFELIVVLDAIDEGVSMNVQARWSYLPHEIIHDAKFVEITHFNPSTEMYEVDFAKFNDFAPAYPTPTSINADSSMTFPPGMHSLHQNNLM